MKKKSVLLLLAAALILVFALVGCTESYKQNKIDGDYSSPVVVSESGLGTVLKLGDKHYFYFVNGVAGQTAENNVFGKVLKGAIVRVELTGADGDPILSTKTVVVPKNVFATEAESSFRIRGNYIYYSTPNVVQGNDGKAKTSEMVLMRTSLDGTATEIIKTFTAEDGGFSNVYRVTEREIVYYYQNQIFRIDLQSNNYESKKIVEEVTAYKFVDGADYILYTKGNEVVEEYSNRLILLPFSATEESEAKTLLDIKSYGENGENLLHDEGYKLTVTAAAGDNASLELYYTKADGGTTQRSAGIYRYNFDLVNGFDGARYVFDFAKEERITATGGKSYTAFQRIDDDSMYATDANGIYFLVRETVRSDGLTLNWKPLSEVNSIDPDKNVNADIVVAGAKFLRYEEKDGAGNVYYFNGTKLQYRTVFTVSADGARSIAMNNSYDLYTISATTSWLNYQLIGKNLYFLNSGVSNYVYFVDTTTFKVRETDYRNVLLSEMTLADKLALMSEKTTV